MQTFKYTENPVQQAYNGGDQLNVRALQAFMSGAADNFHVAEQLLNKHAAAIANLRGKIDECYAFISWVQEHAPEVTAAYKAHNTVLHAFDKASGMEESAETSA